MSETLLFAVPEATTYFCSGCNEVKPASDFTPTNRKRTRARRRCHQSGAEYLARHRGKA